MAQETAHVALWEGDLWKILDVIDVAREGVLLIRQNWQLIVIPNTIALVLACFGLLRPIGTMLISNGSEVVALSNALRPLLASGTSLPAKSAP